MKKNIKLSAIATSIVGTLLLSAPLHAAPSHNKNVIGYLTQWEAWKGPQHGFSVAGEATHLNVDMDIYSILNYSFFGVAKDGSLHSGDLRNKQIYQPDAVQEPGSLLYTDVYSSWDLHILWGELEYLWSYPGNEAWEAENLAKVKEQGFVKNGNGWKHKPSGITGEMPLPLKKEGGAPGLIDLANEKGVKVMASLGGWSMSKHFPEMAADPVKKARFLADIDKLMALGFHGIDIDWEYPGTGGMNFSGSEADYDNFEQLMEDIRDRIGHDKLITAAFKAVPAALEGFDWDRLTRSMDYFNMMTYDLNGGWSDVTGHNSPLYPYPEEEFAGLTIDTLRDWMINQRGIPAEKINFGAAFYGRGVQTTEGTAYLGAPTDKRMVNFEVDGPTNSSVDITNWANFEGQPSYNYLTKQSNWQHFWDDSARVPYAVNGKYFLSYDDPQSIREKAEYIVDNDLGGIIVWQVHGDIECKGSFTSFGSKLKQCSELSSPLAEQIDQVFSQNVTPNTAPVLSVPSALNTSSGQALSFSVSATDADGDALTFSAQGADIIEQANNRATVSFQAPDTAKDIVKQITITVTDGKKSDVETVEIAIEGTGEVINQAPVLNAPARANVNAGDTATISLSASDADNDALTFTTSLGSIVQNGNRATLTIPTEASTQDSTLIVRVSVSDAVESDHASIELSVKGNDDTGGNTWNKDQVYVGGDIVIYNGVEYTAKWWTKGDEPGKSDVWQEKDDGSVKEWNSSKAYNGGDIVTYQGTQYKAKWWTKGDMPGASGSPWSPMSLN
ncbi:glycosyl hydrolase family 18 protein [Vibrio renipiscarius]|uniref:glycosyl hydrolase family 18 protein n=1 Tax=Vibrio renipiscarius TaxID=1461322 RepID=UPI00354C72BE